MGFMHCPDLTLLERIGTLASTVLMQSLDQSSGEVQVFPKCYPILEWLPTHRTLGRCYPLLELNYREDGYPRCISLWHGTHTPWKAVPPLSGLSWAENIQGYVTGSASEADCFAVVYELYQEEDVRRPTMVDDGNDNENEILAEGREVLMSHEGQAGTSAIYRCASRQAKDKLQLVPYQMMSIGFGLSTAHNQSYESSQRGAQFSKTPGISSFCQDRKSPNK